MNIVAKRIRPFLFHEEGYNVNKVLFGSSSDSNDKLIDVKKIVPLPLIDEGFLVPINNVGFYGLLMSIHLGKMFLQYLTCKMVGGRFKRYSKDFQELF